MPSRHRRAGHGWRAPVSTYERQKKLSLPLKELTPRSKAKMLRIQHTPGFDSLTASRLLFSAIFDIENTQHTKTDIKQQVGT